MRLGNETLMHERGGDAADEDEAGVTLGHPQRKVERLGGPIVFEGKVGLDVNPVPSGPKYRGVFTLDEANVVALAERAVILCNLHQSKRRILVLVGGLYQQNVSISH